jgi:hypothetical protein
MLTCNNSETSGTQLFGADGSSLISEYIVGSNCAAQCYIVGLICRTSFLLAPHISSEMSLRQQPWAGIFKINLRESQRLGSGYMSFVLR